MKYSMNNETHEVELNLDQLDDMGRAGAPMKISINISSPPMSHDDIVDEELRYEQDASAAVGQILSFEEPGEQMYSTMWHAYIVIGEHPESSEAVGQLTLTSSGKNSEFLGLASYGFDNNEFNWRLVSDFGETLSDKKKIEKLVPAEFLAECLAEFNNYGC